MKISIITTALNSEKTIEDTLKSVSGQNYADIEHIIIDGGSTDRTLDIVHKYNIQKIVSEKDKGLYDAMNKGIMLAIGEVIGILNSDDVYNSKEVLSKVVEIFEKDQVDCVWGDLVYVSKENTDKVLRYWKSSPYKKGKFQRGWHPPHPTFFVKKDIYQKYGAFREDLSIAADYELMLRFLERYKITSSYIPNVLVKMRVGGKSNKNLSNIIKANRECLKAFKINNLKVYSLIFFLKPFLKIFQFLK